MELSYMLTSMVHKFFHKKFLKLFHLRVTSVLSLAPDFAMSAYAESAASFKHRCKEIGLNTVEVAALETRNLKTFNNLAFAVCGQPGQLDNARFTQVMEGAFHSPTIGLESMMRQLSYEAITVAVAAIRQRVEPQQEGQLKRLPPQERDERIRKQAASITGFTIQGDYEPAHSVVDFFTTMLEECAPRYLPLSKCISREQELQTLKVDKRIVVVEDQQLQIKNKAPEAHADLTTDLKVQNAFVRRGLAGEQAGIFSYNTHEKIRHAFMAHMTRTAPPGFRAPDIGAVLRADRELWMKAFELCKSNIRVDANGTYPLDAALLKLHTSPEVVFHLLPTPGSAPTKRQRSPDKAAVSPSRPAPKKTPKPNPRPKNKRGGNNNNRVKVPEALKGFSGMNNDNLRVCYNYNLPHGCSNSTHEKDGHTRCVKGCHECIKCGGRHSMQSCPKK